MEKRPASRNPEIVYEDRHLLALSKPFGMPSQRDPSGDPAVIDWAAEYLGREPHLLHRLDRPTGGLILLAKSAAATRSISRQFEQRTVEKVYLAVTDSKVDFEEIELEHFLGKLPGKNFVRAYDKPVRHSKPAKLRARLSARKDGLSLLEIHPLTGRRHQIRAQLKALRLQILGDFKYGKGGPALPYPGIALWAFRASVRLPGSETLTLEATPPDMFPWNRFS